MKFRHVAIVLALSLALIAPAAEAAAGVTKAAQARSTVGRCRLFTVERKEQCVYVTRNEACVDDGLFPYLELYACHVRLPYALILLGLWSAVLFGTLATVAEKVFAPAMEFTARMLRLRADIAGATLLSLGNSAPDVFTQFAAADPYQRQGAQVAVAEVLGAGFFTCTCGLALVALVPHCNAGRVDVLPGPFARDSGFYLLSVLALASSLALGRFHVWHAGLFAGIYVAYIAFLYLSRRYVQGVRATSEWQLTSGGSESALDEVMDGMVIATGSNGDRSAGAGSDGAGKRGTSVALVALLRGMSRACEEVTLLTVPDVRKGARHRPLQSALRPLCLCVFTALGENLITIQEAWQWDWLLLWATLGALGVGWELVLLDNRGLLENERMQNASCIAAVLGSIVWMDVVASELVTLVAACGRIFGLSQGFLAETVLAWGNSIGDAFANMAIARSGEPHMAYAACFASPMVNLLIGQTLSNAYRTFALGQRSIELSCPRSLGLTLTFHILSLLHSFIGIPFLYRCAALSSSSSLL